jgi:predicted nucleic acid-binding protein
MSAYYLDTSALVKRYFPETGTAWMLALTDQAAGNDVILSELTMVEAAAAIAAKHRAPDGITLHERDDALNDVLRRCDTEYQLIPSSRAILERAVALTQNYRLRGYDAIQLATALLVADAYRAASITAPTFVAADADLLAAARDEGLPTENPNDHP